MSQRVRLRQRITPGGTLHCIHIRNGDGSEEIYDLASDPLQAVDLAGQVEIQALVGYLRAALDSSASTDALVSSNAYVRAGRR